MAEGLAKTATPPMSGYTQVQITPSSPINTVGYEGVPIDVYRFFSVDIGNVDSKTLSKLREISDWSFHDSSTLGDGLKKMRDLEIKLGSVHGNEQRWDKMYNWVKMQRHMDEIRKRQEALSR